MIPFGNETVTLVQRTETVAHGKTHAAYAVTTLTGCSWQRTQRWNREAEVLAPYEGIVCRVPAGQTKPKPGDLMILGNVTVTVAGGADFQRLVEQYRDTDGAFVVAAVADNARPGSPLPHYAARS
jgi:hypothetical protein